MAKGEASEQVILQLRAVLRGISPLIWRRLLVPSDASIAQHHDILQVAFGWDNMHLHRFEIRDCNSASSAVAVMRSALAKPSSNRAIRPSRT
jgi:hypothetical protein